MGRGSSKGHTDDGTGIVMAMQATDVKRTLGSVYRMNQAGNMVVLDGNNSYMVHKQSGKRTKIAEENGQFVFYLWIQQSTDESQKRDNERLVMEKKEQAKKLKGNRYGVLAEVSEGPSGSFSWQE